MTQIQHNTLPSASFPYGPTPISPLSFKEAEPGKLILGAGGRDWQQTAFDKVKDARFIFCVAFCGSGKSTLIKYLAAYDSKQSGYRQKQLIAIPQSIIAGGFVESAEMRLEGETFHWIVRENLNFCADHSANVIDGLKRWLLKKPRKNAELNVAVCTHSNLARAMEQIDKDGCLSEATRNLSLTIDEAHHVNHVFDDQDGYTDKQVELLEGSSTKLGAICREIMKGKTAKIRLATATPFRGDEKPILSDQVKPKFEAGRYDLPFDIHWKTLNIKDFAIEYETYEKTPFDQVIDRIQSEPNERHLVIIPAAGKKWRKDSDPYETFLRQLRKAVPADEILDLVTPSTQAVNKILLAKEPKESGKGASKYRVVLTCMIGREGLDWVPCSRVHNTWPESSLTLAVQTIGRPMRRYEGKEHVGIYVYVRAFNRKSEDDMREALSDRTNGLLVAMQFDQTCSGLLVPVIPEGKDEEHRRGERRNIPYIMGALYKPMLEAVLESCCAMDVPKHSVIRENVKRILKRFPPKIKCDKEVLVEQIVAYVVNRYKAEVSAVPSLKGLDVSLLRTEHGFDKVMLERNIHGAALYCGIHSENDLKVVREWATTGHTDWVPVAEKLAKENGGLLPRACWLQKNGYKALYADIKRNPSRYSHIPRETFGHTDWVPVAEKLARENGGLLQGAGWLQKNGYKALYVDMRRNPSRYSHIPRETPQLKRSRKEHLEEARALVAKYGAIPPPVWLQENGYGSLPKCLLKYPEVFVGLKQEKMWKTNEEHVASAKALAEQNGGFLDLRVLKREHCQLLNCYYKNRKLFSHIPVAKYGTQGVSRGSHGDLRGFTGGTAAQRKALEIKHGLRKK